MAINRRQFIGIATAASGICLAFSPMRALAQVSSPKPPTNLRVGDIATVPRVNVKTFGVVGDGITDDSDALKRALSSGGDLLVPRGNYVIKKRVVVSGVGGSVLFEDGSVLLNRDPTQGAIFYQNCSNLTIDGLTTRLDIARALRSFQGSGILFQRCINLTALALRVEGAHGAGILFDECTTVAANDLYVENTGADGVHFSNCGGVNVTLVRTKNTGDDGLAFVNYAAKPEGGAAAAADITIVDSKARGIAVVGQSDVHVDRFSINGTAAPGIIVAEDTAYATRIPSRVTIQTGTVQRVGAVLPNTGNQFGASISSAVTVKLANIKINGGPSRGISVNDATGIAIEKTEIYDTADDAINIQRADVTLNDVKFDRVAGYAAYFDNCSKVAATLLQVGTVATAKSAPGVLVFNQNKSVTLRDVRSTIAATGRKIYLSSGQVGEVQLGSGTAFTLVNQSLTAIKVL